MGHTSAAPAAWVGGLGTCRIFGMFRFRHHVLVQLAAPVDDVVDEVPFGVVVADRTGAGPLADPGVAFELDHGDTQTVQRVQRV